MQQSNGLKFSQLNERARIRAVFDYWQGMREAFSDFEDDSLSVPAIEDCLHLVKDCENDLIYDSNGILLDEEGNYYETSE